MWLTAAAQLTSRVLLVGVQTSVSMRYMPVSALSDVGPHVTAALSRSMALKAVGIHGGTYGASLQCQLPQQFRTTTIHHNVRHVSQCAVLACKASEKSVASPKRHMAATNSHTAGLGVLGMFGLFGKRLILVLGGKKAMFGLFSIVSLKKLLFLPAWLTVLYISAGAHTSGGLH